eukprot:ctg_155.g130
MRAGARRQAGACAPTPKRVQTEVVHGLLAGAEIVVVEDITGSWGYCAGYAWEASWLRAGTCRRVKATRWEGTVRVGKGEGTTRRITVQEVAGCWWIGWWTSGGKEGIDRFSCHATSGVGRHAVGAGGHLADLTGRVSPDAAFLAAAARHRAFAPGTGAAELSPSGSRQRPQPLQCGRRGHGGFHRETAHVRSAAHSRLQPRPPASTHHGPVAGHAATHCQQSQVGDG